MIESTEQLKRNIETVRERIKRAAERSGRSAVDIMLVAVSKTALPETVKASLDFGLSVFAENRVNEFLSKYDFIGDKCKWHFIGRLQRNKVKYIENKAALIHSVESLELAKELQKRAYGMNIIQEILVQVNISGEKSKQGIKKEDTVEFLRELSKYPNIKVMGLMTMAPHSDNPEDSRWVFRGLKQLSLDIQGINIDNINMDYLSMGMSNDFETAIEEGSNMVRIGSAIFGS